ncbi:MAG TPA: hypothetical protein VHH12_09035 [Mycobacterium sp.]|nr:hypothetical protein [Mycobacterium sp.]
MLQQIAFRVHKKVHGFDVPDRPVFDTAESTEWFIDKLRGARRYLEFGAGGSTYVAAQLGVEFVTVDSDPKFLEMVRSKVLHDGYAAPNQVFRHHDIGPTALWGRPVGSISSQRLELFRRYSDTPPECLQGKLPDLVLIDGRFRIPCALKMLYWLTLRRSENMLIVVDDYTDRPMYQALEEFARIQCVGRMAVLTDLKPFAPQALIDAVERWETVRD